VSPRRHRAGGGAGGAPHGFGGFLRSLLDGIPWSERAEGEEELRAEAPAGGRLRLHNANGATRVCGEDRSDVLVRAHKRARAESELAAKQLLEDIRILLARQGDALELEVVVPRRWNRRGHANLEVRVPRGLCVEISAVNARVEVEGLRSSVTARSSNGSARICDVIGDIEVSTSNARVFCACTCGRLVARSSNGKIVLKEHRGDVDASTSNGLINVSLEEVGRSGVQLCTSNGRIALELPDEVDADVDLRVDNGVIRNDRELDRAVRERDGLVRGRLGAGGPLIRLRTSNGSISLR
jgi:hypothetical protein